jgi:hypothetical protein
MSDISLHHNYIHDVTGEGFYIGNSFYASGAPGLAACAARNPDSHKIIGVKVFKNNVRRSGVEGIQVGCAIEGCKVYDNVLDSLGQNPFEPNQDNGLQLGEGTGGLCYNNWISNSVGNGIICLGIGDNVIYNNVIYKTGESGVYIGELANVNSGKGVKLINNTIINPTNNGVRVSSGATDTTVIYNNIIVKPTVASGDPYVRAVNANTKMDQKGNYFTDNIANVLFNNSTNLDFRLKTGSPAISGGVNVTPMGVTYDLNNYVRNLPIDIGAYELGSTTGSPITSVDYRQPVEVEKSFFVYPNPVNKSNQDLTFEFKLDVPSKVSVLSYDINGRLIEENLNQNFDAGLNRWTISSNSQSNAKVNCLVFKLMVNGVVKDSQTVIFK